MKDLERDGRLLTALLDAMPDAVLVSDNNGTITRANHATGRLFGYDPADLIGDSVGTLMPQAMADRGDGFMQTRRETGQERRVEGLRRNGETFALNLSVGHASYEGEDHFVAILHGLGVSTTAQEVLARTARLDAIGQMTTGISHDFSNLLTVIMGNLELLEKKLHDPEEQAMLADAQEAAAMGAELTAGLSAFARNTAGKFDAISVNAACETALTLIGRTFDPQYEISLTLADDLPAVMADTTKLQSALINIALNARDAMPEGGKVMIRTEVVTIDDDYIAQELDVSEGVYVRISITDTGLGMGPDTQQRVFEPYFTTKPVGHGTGLGLAMVYGFVRQCGGHVTVYSEIGHGTTIALYFPIANAAYEQTQSVAGGSSAKTVTNRTVLVVEDNPQIRRLTTVRLRDLGYRVREAERGDIAADMLREDADIHAVFTDLVMPGELDGLGLARHVVATYPHIRILLTSGYAEDILGRDSDKPDHRILRKPYRQSDLSKALSALFTDS